MGYPDGVSFKGTPYDTDCLPSTYHDEADDIKAAIKSIEAIKSIARARLIIELDAIKSKSYAAADYINREAKTSAPVDTLADCALDNFDDYALHPMEAALEEVEARARGVAA